MLCRDSCTSMGYCDWGSNQYRRCERSCTSTWHTFQLPYTDNKALSVMNTALRRPVREKLAIPPPAARHPNARSASPGMMKTPQDGETLLTQNTPQTQGKKRNKTQHNTGKQQQSSGRIQGFFSR
eukprot:scpid103578/ scgid11528/ 